MAKKLGETGRRKQHNNNNNSGKGRNALIHCRGKSKPVRRTRPLKIAALIVSAIEDLKETKGMTSSQIADYISYGSELPDNEIKKQVRTALSRGLRYGILRKHKGQYFLPHGDDLERANRVASRFSTLHSGITIEEGKSVTLEDLRDGPIIAASKKEQKQQRRPRTVRSKSRRPATRAKTAVPRLAPQPSPMTRPRSTSVRRRKPPPTRPESPTRPTPEGQPPPVLYNTGEEGDAVEGIDDGKEEDALVVRYKCS
ncbi:hypothetical protein QAD02_016850 [Eretmocerus hayati]|uniref:Uncharacterized protein n=1 Tax=Eretmocerus hayati TaxID=131215 RepID=A0ACC2PDA1_9HYME|nr:hypothetical protein QAD02_016850 [Eretmocerus hayati]